MRLSDQFKKDYRQMTAQGVKFTPEDIVLMNALSFKTQLSTTAARDVHLPRLAFLPRDSWWRAPIVLREPTVAHDLWLEMAERWVDTSRDENFLFLHAFALSHHTGKLPDVMRPSRVIKAVFRFAEKRLCRFTRAQLQSAVEYCLYGADWTVGASAPKKVVDESGSGRKEESNSALQLQLQTTTEPSPTIGLLTDCRMLRLPISLDDARQMTASELTEAINRAWDQDEKFNPKRAHAAAFGEYVRAREAIRARSLTVPSRPSATGAVTEPREAIRTTDRPEARIESTGGQG